MNKGSSESEVDASRRAALKSIGSAALASGVALALTAAPARAAQVCHPRRARLAVALKGGFGVRYWGADYTAQSLAAAPHGLLIMEPALEGADPATGRRERGFTPAEVAAIRRDGARPVYAYANLGEAAPYRDYWLDRLGTFDPPVGSGPSDGWLAGRNLEGEFLTAFWSPAWARLLADQVDAMLAAGYDGVFLDDALHYFTWGGRPPFSSPGAPTSLAASAIAMMRLVISTARHARRGSAFAREDFGLIVNGAPFIGWDAASPRATEPHPIFDLYLAELDGVAIEGALLPVPTAATVAMLRDGFASGGVNVLTIDFHVAAPDIAAETLRAQVTARAHAAGMHPYLAETQRFDALAPPLVGPFSGEDCDAAAPRAAAARRNPE